MSERYTSPLELRDHDSGRVKSAALAVLMCASLLVVLACLIGGPLGEWVLALCSVAFPVALILMVSDRIPRRRPVRWALVALALMMGVSISAVLVLSAGRQPSGLLGLPPATLIMLAGLGLGPLLLVIWAHAATFGDRGPPR